MSMKISVLIRYIILTVLFGLTAYMAAAARVSEADSAYAAENYSGAVRIYNEVIAEKGESSELLYNLGNAYSKGGDYGHAMASYLRALRLDPSNSQAWNNVEYIDSKVLDANKNELKGKKYSLDSESPTFFTSVKNYIARDHASDTWAVWSAVCFVLFILSVALYAFSRQVIARKIGFFGGFVFLGISAISIVFAFMSASYASDEGVVTTAKVKLHSEASLSSKEGPVNLTRGTRMKILDVFPADSENPTWYKVRLNSDFVGWLSADDFIAVGR